MNILVFNSGSSSLTYKVFGITNSGSINVLVSGKAHRVGVTGSEPSFIENSFKGKFQKDTKPIRNHSEAARLILQYVKQTGFDIDYIGHRFVHGGGYFKEAVFINETVLKKLEECVPLAPIHNPSSLSVIKESAKFYPNIRQYVSFDSAFHSAIPDYAYTYPLPKKIIEKYGFRKYGFHGLSYSYVVREAARVMGVPLENLKIVACHLGTGGASAVAIKNGRSIDTSMGYSPLSGLMMSTRSGDIDPMLTLYLMTVFGYRPDSLMEVLNEKSGLLGISGFSSDIRDIIKRVSGKEEQAGLALDMYIHRSKKYIGSYIIILKGIDALIFTDDIGVHNWLVREKVCDGMQWCGIKLDNNKNRKATDDVLHTLSTGNSGVHVFSIPTEEELVICQEGIKLTGENHAVIV